MIMKKDEVSKLLTLKEAAEKLRVSEQTLRRWDNSGHFKAVRVGTRRGLGDRRYRVEDVEDYIKQRGKKKKG
ncbi:MAG: DNA-binding protein, excisionase family [Candidatus Amesbacteria bacterium GW2011_GWA1_44_24]|nr:MAG: DNA-binding protein, excisionase family [Candidatus Amesbacteria bacterium GW2011_GWA1_44_24]